MDCGFEKSTEYDRESDNPVKFTFEMYIENENRNYETDDTKK